MKTMIKNLVRLGFLAAMLSACGSNNNCPSGETMVNNVCTVTSGVYGTTSAYGTVCQQGAVGCTYNSQTGQWLSTTGAYGNTGIYGTTSPYGVTSVPGYQNYGSQGGYVQTSQGLLPVGTCGAYPGYGYLNGYCVR
jgi:hypothetical protein